MKPKLFENIEGNQFKLVDKVDVEPTSDVNETEKHTMTDDHLLTLVDTMMVTKQPDLIVRVLKEVVYRLMHKQ